MHNFRKRAAVVLAALIGAVSVVIGAAPAQATLTYYHAGASQTYATTSVSVNLAVNQPAVDAGVNSQSLAELAVESADTHQVIEVGWRVSPPVSGVAQPPRLFVGSWINGAFTCYNTCGFTLYAGRTYTPGDSLASFVGLAGKQFAVLYSGGNWWIYFNGTAIGYYPESNWTGAVPPVASFNQTGFIQMFGEVTTNGGTPCTDMGNALPASNTSAGKFDSTTYAQGAGVVSLTTFNSSNPAWYTAQLQTGSVRTFRYGGPGNC